MCCKMFPSVTLSHRVVVCVHACIWQGSKCVGAFAGKHAHSYTDTQATTIMVNELLLFWPIWLLLLIKLDYVMTPHIVNYQTADIWSDNRKKLYMKWVYFQFTLHIYSGNNIFTRNIFEMYNLLTLRAYDLSHNIGLSWWRSPSGCFRFPRQTSFNYKKVFVYRGSGNNQ
jgi:hypothetical protein